MVFVRFQWAVIENLSAWDHWICTQKAGRDTYENSQKSVVCVCVLGGGETDCNALLGGPFFDEGDGT